MASKVEEAFSCDVFVAQPPQHSRHVEIKQVVIVPCGLVSMDEDCGIRKIVIVVDDVSKIRH